ncbi:MAG: magnesium transporter [Thermoplasmata archaeon]|nr:magnesium transporter [Thermoplasmata archaeon]
MKGWTVRVITEAIPALILLGLGDFLAGLYLGAHSATLAAIPGLLTLLPVVMDFRGNIHSVLSAKASTIIHVEGITGLRSTEMKKTVGSLLFSKSVLPIISILLAYLYYKSVGYIQIDLEGVTFIVYSSAIVMFPIIVVFLFTITVLGFHFGMDPDHYGIPLIMGFADVLTLVLMTHFAMLNRPPLWMIFLIPLIMIIISFVLGISLQMLKAVYLVQIFCVLLDLVAGVILEKNLEIISKHYGLLVILPLVNSELGGIGGILSSKYSTNLNLGSLKPNLAPRRGHCRYLMVAVPLGALIFTVLSILSHFLGGVTLEMCILLVVAGTAISIISWFLVHFISIFSYSHGLDPDILTPPSITSMMDILGTLMILFISLSS